MAYALAVKVSVPVPVPVPVSVSQGGKRGWDQASRTNEREAANSDDRWEVVREYNSPLSLA